MTPKYECITVDLVGKDGTAAAILGRVSGAMKRGNIVKSERDKFMAEATAGDYDHLLATVMRWVQVN